MARKLLLVSSLLLSACGGSTHVPPPPQPVDNIPALNSTLTQCGFFGNQVAC